MKIILPTKKPDQIKVTIIEQTLDTANSEILSQNIVEEAPIQVGISEVPQGQQESAEISPPVPEPKKTVKKRKPKSQ